MGGIHASHMPRHGNKNNLVGYAICFRFHCFDYIPKQEQNSRGILFPRLFPCFLFETETYSRLLRGFALFPTQKQNKIEWLDFVFDSEYGKLLPPPTTIKGEVRI